MRMERHATTAVGRKHSVQHERVNVHVQVQGCAKALDNGHRAAAAIHHTAILGLTTQPAEHGAQIDRDHGPAERVVPRQQVAKTRGQGQDELTDRDVREHVIDQVRGTIGHAATATARTEPAPLARERY